MISESEAQLDAELEARNAEIRQRFVTDPDFRRELNVLHKKCVARHKSAHSDASARWLYAWRMLHSEDQRVVEGARRSTRRLMDAMVSVTLKACAETEPKVKEATEEPEEDFGLANEH